MKSIEEQYIASLNETSEHYENFPVVSFFVPKELRKHVAVIYKYARTADDFADEEKFSNEDRLLLLDNYQNDFELATKGTYKNNFWRALDNTIKERSLSTNLFIDLLTAFKQDLKVNRYITFDEILLYCKNSANPVGRLILELNNIRDEEANYYSDEICTALQLTNFYQDVSIDLTRDRVYFPLDEFGNYSTDKLFSKVYDNDYKQLMKKQIERSRKMFENGRNLLKFLNKRLKYQIKWTILGGELILTKIEKNNYDVFEYRPKVTKIDIIRLITKSVI